MNDVRWKRERYYPLNNIPLSICLDFFGEHFCFTVDEAPPISSCWDELEPFGPGACGTWDPQWANLLGIVQNKMELTNAFIASLTERVELEEQPATAARVLSSSARAACRIGVGTAAHKASS